MTEEVIEEEVLKKDTHPTDEELYDAEYDKAWSDEEDIEQSPEETETDVDVPVEVEDVENSIEAEESDVEAEESEEKPSEEFAEVLKWKGKEIPVTREELIILGQKGFDSEKKWQEAAVNRPIKELVDKYGFTVEQLEMFGNITSDKNAEALALLAQQNGIDLFEAEHKNYKPKVEAVNYELQDVIAEINSNEEIAIQMNDYVSSVPQSVKDTLTSRPDVLRGLNIDMQQGIAQKVMPEVIKQLAINPRQDFVQLYRSVGSSMYSNEVKAEEVKPSKPVATREEKKKVAVSNKNSAPTKSIVDDYDAAWDDNEAFERVKARLSGF